MDIQNFQNELNREYWGNNLGSYLVALGVFLITYIVLDIILRRVLLGRLIVSSEKTETKMDDLVVSTVKKFDGLFYISISALVAIQIITLNSSLLRLITILATVIFTFYIVRGLQGILLFLIHDWGEKQKKETGEGFDQSLVQLAGIATNIILWSLASIIVLQNFNVNVAALIGGLGISGIAIAFALQNILVDIFASFTIYLDKPFQVGDLIQIGDDMGYVQKIGIKSTKIKTIQGEELIVGNKELTQTRVRNFARLKQRRVSFNLGIDPLTKQSELITIPQIVNKIISKIGDAEFVRCHLRTEDKDSLNFEVIYSLDTGDFEKYLDIQQEINFKLKEKLKVVKIG
ncbi:MAG: mechanosensitive ion channel domain-containing protein [bacterium]